MSDWKQIIGAIAPSVAGLLGGPLAATAVGALSRSLLGRDNGTESEIAEVVSVASPEILAKIKETEAQLKRDLANAGVKIEEIAAGDRASARQMASITGVMPQIILSIIYTVGYFALMNALLNEQIAIAASMEQVFLMLVGVLTGAQVQILNFWFGTSLGSKEKTAILGGR